MNFHTALDVAPQALSILPTLLRLKPRYVLDPLAGKADKGFGMVCASEEGAISLKHLAARSVSVFGSVPRVWGNPDTLLESIVTCGGSANDLVDLCLENGIDCLICGEVKYHVALEARPERAVDHRTGARRFRTSALCSSRDRSARGGSARFMYHGC